MVTRNDSANGQNHMMDEILLEEDDNEMRSFGVGDEIDEEEEEIGDDDSRPMIGSRAEKSLGLLTQRFLRLLQTARSGIVDLNTVGFLSGKSLIELYFSLLSKNSQSPQITTR